MRILLCALNAKYVHSNLALRCLREYARFSFSDKEQSKIEIKIAEYTINQHFNEILKDIYLKKPDLIGFSCYIWNITYVKRLIVELKKVLPDTRLWLGGPEVSYNSVKILKDYPQLSGIVVGEGEVTFSCLIKGENPKSLQGITFRDEKGQIQENLPSAYMDLDWLPFPYQDIKDLSNQIIYYESSRGCPFSCSYCLSSEEGSVRFRSLEKVKKELEMFIEMGATKIKFVDRTFNCDGKRARAIWKHIQENDNKKVNFHFEIVADLLEEADFELLGRLRPGLVQFEIGIQSTNLATLKEINRTMDYPKVAEAIGRLNKLENIHLHVDLIAGLPKEDAKSFTTSFNQVYGLKVDKLQLGFLKLLVGSAMEKRKEVYELITQEMPPYEVLSTKWLSFNDILRIKSVEEMLEIYYNSRQFLHSINYLENEFPTPFHLYESLSEYYIGNGYERASHSREKRYEILLEFVRSLDMPDGNVEEFRQLLILDYYLRENPKKRPAFAGVESLSKEEIRDFYDEEITKPIYLEGCQGMEKRKLRKMTHLERINGKVYLFDYRKENTESCRSKVHIIL